MTATDTAQNRSETTAAAAKGLNVPAPASEIAHDALYNVLGALTTVAGVVLDHVDRNTVDVHRDLERLRTVHQRAHDLLYPPPPPNAPEGAEVLYAHAVRAGDLIWDGPHWGWRKILDVTSHDLGVRFNVVADPADAPGRAFLRGDLLVVQRTKPMADQS